MARRQREESELGKIKCIRRNIRIGTIGYNERKVIDAYKGSQTVSERWEEKSERDEEEREEKRMILGGVREWRSEGLDKRVKKKEGGAREREEEKAQKKESMEKHNPAKRRSAGWEKRVSVSGGARSASGVNTQPHPRKGRL